MYLHFYFLLRLNTPPPNSIPASSDLLLLSLSFQSLFYLLDILLFIICFSSSSLSIIRFFSFYSSLSPSSYYLLLSSSSFISLYSFSLNSVASILVFVLVLFPNLLGAFSAILINSGAIKKFIVNAQYRPMATALNKYTDGWDFF